MKSDDHMPPRGWSPSGRKSDFIGNKPTHIAIDKGVIRPDDALYPGILKEVIKKPFDLYYHGNTSLLRPGRVLSVVGSRNTTSLTQRNLEYVLGPIHDQPITIVSGLALGLDALAHALALENNLPTIAVLGSSVEEDEIYPRSNFGLARQVLRAKGLLLSPFPPHTPIMEYNFPIRNQIIAALSQATLIASAAKKSGALITGRLALEYGKDVFVIPGSITDPLYEGSNNLLQQGAGPILSAQDILDYFQLGTSPQRSYATDDHLEAQILEVLKSKNVTSNELSQMLNVPANAINLTMSKLELKGWIAINSGGTIQLK